MHEEGRISSYSHVSSCLSLPFLYPLLGVCSGVSGLVVRQSQCLYHPLGFPSPLLPRPTTKCCTLMVYLTFCRGAAGKGHSHISLDHMAAPEWSWSHCHRCEGCLCHEGTPMNAAVATQGMTYTYCQVQVHLQLKVKQKGTGNFEKQKCRNACLRQISSMPATWWACFTGMSPVWLTVCISKQLPVLLQKAKYWWAVLCLDWVYHSNIQI